MLLRVLECLPVIKKKKISNQTWLIFKQHSGLYWTKYRTFKKVESQRKIHIKTNSSIPDIYLYNNAVRKHLRDTLFLLSIKLLNLNWIFFGFKFELIWGTYYNHIAVILSEKPRIRMVMKRTDIFFTVLLVNTIFKEHESHIL